MFDNLNAVLQLDEKDFTRSLGKAEGRMERFGDQAQSMGKRAQRAGAVMTAGLTAPLTAMGFASARLAGNFQQQMANSIAVMGDVSDAMREELEQTAREVARTTTFSAAEAAEAFYFLSSAGLDAEQSMASLPQVADFAAAGNMNLAEATDVATNVMSAYNVEAENMTEVTDILSATVSNHNQTMEGLSSAMSQVAPIASTLGISLEEASTALGMMGDVGIQAQRSGTALRNVLSQLSDEGSPVVKELQDMGVATRNAEGDMVSLTQLLTNMEEAGIEAGQAASIFGTEAGPAMAALMNQGSSALAENTTNIREMEGATADMAATQRDEFNSELAMTRSTIEDVAISMGTTMMPALRSANAVLRDVASGFQNMSDTQRKVVIGVGAVLAVIGPLLLFLGTLGVAAPAVASGFGILAGAANALSMTLFGRTIPALLATNVALGPITVPIWAIIAAVGALIAIGAGLHHAWTTNLFGVRDVTTDAFRTVKGWLDAAPGWVLALLGPIGWLYAAWRENLFGVQDIVESVFDWIGSKIGWLIDQIDRLPGIDMGPDDPSDAAPDVDAVADESAAVGEAGGAAYKQAYEAAAQPDASAFSPDSGEVRDSIETETTPAIRQALESSVEGFVSDPEEIGDRTSVNRDLIEAVSKQQGGASPEALGLTVAEFNELMGGTSTGTGGASQSPPPTATRAPSSARSGQVPKLLKQLISLMESLTVEGELEVDDVEFDEVIDGRVRMRFRDERDRFDRGASG